MASQQDRSKYTESMKLRSGAFRYRGPVSLTVSQISANRGQSATTSKGGLSFMIEDIQTVFDECNCPYSKYIVTDLSNAPSLVVASTERAAEADYTKLLFEDSTLPTVYKSAQPFCGSAFKAIWFHDDLMNSISSQEGAEKAEVEGMCVGVSECNPDRNELC
ncbi:hypothetical protein V865_001622 [Kwoniella europaea PYCC6329]|uniref:Uncharacterized protein n=1 Tax=Kwoniella europaea PYCC6329 TaxID=1423913 RepID=A0AAX4KCD2_9TREE